ncbi:hypothetical protein ES705_42706 [subsurface metagenome]
MGENNGSITTSYSNGTVTGEQSVGGLVGGNGDGTITSSYSTGTVTGDYNVGGLVGYSNSSITLSFWDMESSGISESDGGVGLTTAEMMDPYMLGLNGLGNNPNWILDAGRDYPRLTWEGTTGQSIGESEVEWLTGSGTADDPYCINTSSQLIMLSKAGILWDRHFLLCTDIDLDSDLTGQYIFGQAVIYSFAGFFDGNDHVISNLWIKGSNHLGLFGQLASGAQISNLGLESVDVNGTGDYIGGLVGSNDGSITNCYSTGSVSGGSHYVGGLVGDNDGGIITSCYSNGTITGERYVGGLVGFNSKSGSITTSYSNDTVTGEKYVGGLVGWNSSSITSSYSTGTITGEMYVGGLVGYNSSSITSSYSTGTITGERFVGGLVGYNFGGSITSSFWDIETSGKTTSKGGTGLTTTKMQTANTFLEAGWDFIDETANGTEDIWWILEGQDYPRLSWEAAEQ